MKRSQTTDVLAVVVAIAAGLTAASVEATVTADTIRRSLALNMKLITQYEWKQQITVVRKGTPAEPILERVQIDDAGQMQRTVLSGPDQTKLHGLRAKIAAEVRADVKGMMELVSRYNRPQKLMEAIGKATVGPAAGGAVLLQVKDIVQAGDAMAMTFDASTQRAIHIEIKTDYDGAPMTVMQDYGPVVNGPNVMRSMTASAPRKSLVVKVQSTDFEKAPGISAVAASLK